MVSTTLIELKKMKKKKKTIHNRGAYSQSKSHRQSIGYHNFNKIETEC